MTCKVKINNYLMLHLSKVWRLHLDIYPSILHNFLSVLFVKKKMQMITRRREEKEENTLNFLKFKFWKLKNLVYYVKLLNIFIIMENKDEWKVHFFEEKHKLLYWPLSFN